MGFLAVIGSFLLVAVIISIICYLVSSIAIMKVLKILGYVNYWMAWIPVVNTFALADAADGNGTGKLRLFNIIDFELPTIFYKLWFVIGFVLAYVPKVGTVLTSLLSIACMSTVYANIFAKVERRPVEEYTAWGIISGIVPLIACIKFLLYDGNIRVNLNKSEY
jgi:hypothetical protein